MMTDAYLPPNGDNPFDGIADEYEAWYASPLGSFVVAEEQKALLEAVAGASGSLLEVGAGTGWWSRILARRGFIVTALEPSSAMRRVGAAQGDEPIAWLADTADHLAAPDGKSRCPRVTAFLRPSRAGRSPW